MKFLCIITLVAFLGDEPKKDLEAAAKTFLEQLKKGEFKELVKDFDETMLKVLPADKVEEAWKGLIGQMGALKEQKGIRKETKGKYEVVILSCKFAAGELDMRVAFDSAGKIAGWGFVPPKKPGEEYHDPDYARPAAVQEKNVVVGTGDWQLPGTLTVPAGKGPFPAVVLVHGSGSHDADETIGPNKPFRDLALGLGAQGIATLRYVKRTRQFSAKMVALKNTLTLKEEVIEDALAAAALLRKTEGIDPERIYLLGHSLGGMLVPRIATLDGHLAGIISLAGSTRPFADILIDQFNYLISLEPVTADAKRKQLEKMRDQSIRVKEAKDIDKLPPEDLPLGLTVVYLKSLHENSPAVTGPGIKVPFLLLQGGRDYQVTEADIEGWKKALTGLPNITFRAYPNLNHLFIAGQGKAKPSEYEKPGHVDKAVIVDIAAWIKQQR